MLIQWIVDGIQGDAQQGYSSNLASHRYRCILPARGLKKLGFNVEHMNCNDWLSDGSKQTARAIIVAKRLPASNNLDSFIAQNARLLEQLQSIKQQGTPILVDVNDDHFNSPQSAIADYWQNLVHVADLVITGSSTMAERVKQFSNSPTVVIEDPLESAAGEIRVFQRPSAGQALLQNLVSRRGWFNQRLQLVWYGNSVNWPDLVTSIPDLTTLAKDLAFTLKIITTPTPEILSFIKGFNAHDTPNAQLAFAEWKQDTIWQEVAESHIVLLPSNLADRKKAVKTTNRLVEALNIGRFVVAHPVPAYRQLEDYVWLGEQLADGVRWALDNSKLVKQKIHNGQIEVKNQFSIETIAKQWKHAIETVSKGTTITPLTIPSTTPVETTPHAIAKQNSGSDNKVLPSFSKSPLEQKSNQKNTLIAIYDLGYYAPTFNLFEFFTNARIWQKDNNFNTVRLIILKRKLVDSLIIQPQDFSGYDFRIQDILANTAALFAVEELEITDDLSRVGEIAKNSSESLFPPNWQAKLSSDELQKQRYYLQRFISDHLRKGGILPGIQIPPFAFAKIRSMLENYPKPWISITIRRAKHLVAKNSNLDTWQAVSEHFKKMGGSVFLIPDIESIEEFPCPEPIASMAVSNLLYRATLYDACDLNFAVSNGSTAPLWFNPSAVYLLAKFATEGTNTSREHTRELAGLNEGDLLWNKVPWQQGLWSNDDNPEEIIKEGEKLLALCAVIKDEIKDTPMLLDPWGKPDGTISALWRGIDFSQPITEVKNKIRQHISIDLPDIVKECHFSAKHFILDADYFLEISQYEDALAAAKKAIKLDGRYIQPYIIAAKCYEALYNSAYAKKYIQTAQFLTL